MRRTGSSTEACGCAKGSGNGRARDPQGMGEGSAPRSAPRTCCSLSKTGAMRVEVLLERPRRRWPSREPDARDDARLDEEGEVKSDRARHQRRELLLVRLEYFHAAVSAHGACAHCRTRHAKWHTGGRMVSCVVRRTKLLRSGCRAWPARAATLSRSRRTARSGSKQQWRLCKRALRVGAQCAELYSPPCSDWRLARSMGASTPFLEN